MPDGSEISGGPVGVGLAQAPGGVMLESPPGWVIPGLAAPVRLESFMEITKIAAITAMQAVRKIRFSLAEMGLDFFLWGRCAF